MNPAELEQQIGLATQGFTAVDWLIVVVVTVSMLWGLARGFAREVLSLLGWVAAFLLANLLASTVANAIAHLIGDGTLRYLVAWGLVFISVLAVSGVVTSMASRQLRQPGLDIGNRLLGAAFGMMRGVVVMVVLIWTLRVILPDAEEGNLDRSVLMPTIDAVIEWVDENIGHWLEAPAVTEASQDLVPGDML